MVYVKRNVFVAAFGGMHMKKLLTVLLSVMMLFALAGCKSGDKQEEIAPADENPAAEVETAPDEPIMGAWIDIEDGTLSNELENIFNTARNAKTA